MMIKSSLLVLLVFILSSCTIINNDNFSDRRFKRMLIKNIWLDSGTGFGYFYNYEKFKEQGGYAGYQYSLIKFKKDGSFNYNRIFGGKRGDFDSLGIIKYENTYWTVKNRQLHTKAKITYRDFNSKDSTMLELIEIKEKVYNINIRKSTSIKDFEIDFYDIKEQEKWYRIQDFKVIKSLKK